MRVPAADRSEAEGAGRRSRAVLYIGNDHVAFSLSLEAGSLDGFARRRRVRREDVKCSFTARAVAVDVDVRLRDGVECLRDRARPIRAQVDSEILACGLHASLCLLPAGTRTSPPGRDATRAS